MSKKEPFAALMRQLILQRAHSQNKSKLFHHLTSKAGNKQVFPEMDS